jgi:rubrerythrin
MAEKYAGSEVLQMAVELEKKGKAFYDGVVAAMKDARVKDIFQFLADEEVRHEKVFRNMLSDLEPGSASGPYDDTEMILYFKSLIDRKIFPDADEGVSMKKELSDVSTALRIALSLEKDAVLFFHEMQSVTHEKDYPAVERIIDEERDHIRRILKLKSELQV